MIRLSHGLLVGIELALGMLTTSRSLARGSTDTPRSRVEWQQSATGVALKVPLTELLTTKQRQMIDGGFTTMSQFDIVANSPDASDASYPSVGEILLWSSSCTVKFDAWDESYEVTRFHPSRDDLKADSAMFRKFSDYGDFCLTATIPVSAQLLKLGTNGQKLKGRLSVQQMSAGEDARIKEWLVRQQSGLMQSLFKHMLGELALHQSLDVSIAIPPFPLRERPKGAERSPSPTSLRGP